MTVGCGDTKAKPFALSWATLKDNSAAKLTVGLAKGSFVI